MNNSIFCLNQIYTLVAMATVSCHRLIMGKNENWHLLPCHCGYSVSVLVKLYLSVELKMETGINCCELFQKCLLSSPLPRI